MRPDLLESFEYWIKELPILHVKHRHTRTNRVRNVFWRLYTPTHPLMRRLATSLRILRHPGRQRYLLGKLKSGTSPIEFIQYLLEQGFGKHKIAWKDIGEIVGVRKIENNGSHQYHIRLFADGEVRGHYEYTPEYSVRWHMQERGMEERRDYFQKLLHGWIE